MNANKAARIQQLETELERITEEINQLKNRVDTLEHINKQLNVRLLKSEH